MSWIVEGVKSHSHNFGKVKNGETLTTTFKLAEEDSDLTITSIKASCGCTLTKSNKKTVTITYKATASRTATQLAFSKLITASLSDGTEHKLYIKGVVVK